MSKWNGKRFSVYTSEEKTTLGLIKEVGEQANYNTEEVERLEEEVERLESEKTNLYGDHKGTWQGLRPTQTSEATTSILESHETRLNGHDSKLAQKMNKNQAGGVSLAMLSQEVKEAMTGGSVAVVGKHAVLTENIAPTALTASRMDKTVLENFGYSIMLTKDDFIIGKFDTNGSLRDSEKHMCNETLLDVTGIKELYLYQNSGYLAYLRYYRYSATGSPIGLDTMGDWLPIPNEQPTRIPISYADKVRFTVFLSADGTVQNSIVLDNTYFDCDFRYYPNGYEVPRTPADNSVSSSKLNPLILDYKPLLTFKDFSIGKYDTGGGISTNPANIHMCNEVLLDVSNINMLTMKHDHSMPLMFRYYKYNENNEPIGLDTFGKWFMVLPNTEEIIPISNAKKLRFTIMQGESSSSPVQITSPINFEIRDRYTGLSAVNNLSVKIVDKNGNGDYESISEAVEKTTEGSTIIIMPGVYDEAVKSAGKELHFVGISKEVCIIKNSTCSYYTPPLEIACGSMSNITLIADDEGNTTVSKDDTSSKPYAVHIESGYGVGKKLTFNNCKFVSKWNAAVGMGLRPNQTVTFNNCEFDAQYEYVYITSADTYGSIGALFFHDSASTATGDNQRIILNNCILKSINDVVLSMLSIDSKLDNKAYATFYNCMLWSETKGKTDVIWNRNGTSQNGAWVGKNIFLTPDSYGNNVAELNP